MPYRDSGKVVEPHAPPPKLTLKQRYQLLTKNQFDLCDEKWYRAYLGGLWSKAMVAAIDTTLLVQVALSGEPAIVTVAEPYVELPGSVHAWVQAPRGITECIHDNLRGWLTKTTDTFPDNYSKFTEMSMVYQRFCRGNSPVCDCEKYSHRLNKTT